MQSKPPSPRYRSMLRDGWWIGLTALLIITVGTILQVSQSLTREKLIGDGVNPETYGFDLSNLTVPCENLAAYARRDEVPVLTDPEFISVADLARINREGHGKYLVPTDRVIGVEIGSGGRAYPLKTVTVHEIVNDNDAEMIPVYSGLTEVAVVHAGYSSDLCSSGLVLNSQPLWYFCERDQGSKTTRLHHPLFVSRGEEDHPARWHLLARVMQWRDWLAMYPESQVVAPVMDHWKTYRQDPFGPYWQTNELYFPVSPLPPEGLMAQQELRLKSRVICLWNSEGPTALPYDAVLREADFDSEGLGVWRGWIEECETELTLHCRRPDVGFAPETVWFAEWPNWGEANIIVIAPCAFWFAWYSEHPDTVVIDLPPNGTPRPDS